MLQFFCGEPYYSEKIHSGNLYQMFAYLKNLQIRDALPLEGILLYPTVGKSLSLRYRIQGQSMRIITIDLNKDWQEIRASLLGLLLTVGEESVVALPGLA